MEEIACRKNELQRQIQGEENHKIKLEEDLLMINENIKKINQTISHKMESIHNYDKTLAEAENAYTKALLQIIE